MEAFTDAMPSFADASAFFPAWEGDWTEEVAGARCTGFTDADLLEEEEASEEQLCVAGKRCVGQKSRRHF